MATVTKFPYAISSALFIYTYKIHALAWFAWVLLRLYTIFANETVKCKGGGDDGHVQLYLVDYVSNIP